MAKKAFGVDGRDPYVSKNVLLCTDGKYRWVYEMNLLKNPTILFTILKIFGGIILAAGIIGFIFQLFGGHDYLMILKTMVYAMALMAGLSILGYLVYAAIMGFHYCVIFTMDEKGILHQQQPKQAKKAEVIAGLTVLAGIMSSNLTTTGIGMTSSRTSMHTSFEGTKKITAVPRRDLIKLDSLLDHNQVYCNAEDFDFVWQHIKAHCPDPKVVE